MTKYICTTCGTQTRDLDAAPEQCPICADDRQYVAYEGQAWTTHEALGADHTVKFATDGDVLAFGLEPQFAIDQRSALLKTDAGNIMWECQSLVTDDAVARLKAEGGVDLIVISHPHFYSSLGEWSDALGGVPVLLHDADRDWVQRPHSAIEFWSGDTRRLSDDVTLIRCGGHFPGSTALHWATGPRPGGALFAGDALQVGLDRRVVSFMYSYPNAIPMRTSDVVAMRARLAPYAYEDLYGYTWTRNIIGDATARVAASFDRYLDAVNG